MLEQMEHSGKRIKGISTFILKYAETAPQLEKKKYTVHIIKERRSILVTRQYPSQERLRILFNYKDGYLTKKKTGIIVGSIGYARPTYKRRIVGVDYGKFSNARLIWIWHYGEILDKSLQIDHIDRNSLNDRIENLRLVTAFENQQNTNTKGYYWDKVTQSWKVERTRNGKRKWLGRYKTEAEAKEVYSTYYK